MAGRAWTSAEDDAMRALYRGRPIPDALRAALPGRTSAAIVLRAGALGLARRRQPDWTAEESRLVAEMYPDRKRHAALRAALPRRTWSAITVHADRIKARCMPPRWSATEDRILREGWEELSMRTLMAKLRGRSRLAIYQRVTALGLRHGIPQGYESFAAACRRTGYSREALEKILERGGVRRHRLNAQRDAGLDYQTFVEPDEVDAAIAAFMQTETVHAAAVARGLCDKTLRDWLVRAGVIGARVPRAAVRLPTEAIDRVIEEKRATYRPRKRAA